MINKNLLQSKLERDSELKYIYERDFKPFYNSGNLEEASKVFRQNRGLPISRSERKDLLQFYGKKYGVRE